MSVKDEEIKKMELRIKQMETSIRINELNKEDTKIGGSGDVNKDGFVNEGDSKQILDFLVGKGTLDEDNISNAKVTPGIDKVGLIDIITIQREINNLSNKVNNIVPVSLNDKSIEVKELRGKKLNFDEIITNNLKVKNRNISVAIEDLSRNLQKLKLLSGKDSSFNSISTKTLDVSDELKIKGANIIDLLKEKQKKLEKTSSLNIKNLIVENNIKVGDKKIDVGEHITNSTKKFEKIDASMNVLMEGGSTKNEINNITTGYQDADKEILKQVDAKLAESLSAKSNLNLNTLKTNDICGNKLIFQEGTIKTLNMEILKVDGVDVFDKIDELEQKLNSKVFQVDSMLSPETDLSLNELTVAKLYIRKDNTARGNPIDVMDRIDRQIKELDETVDILKQSVSVVMSLLSEFLREK
jgi:hypothetical protein